MKFKKLDEVWNKVPLFCEQKIRYTVKDKLTEQACIINSGDIRYQTSVSNNEIGNLYSPKYSIVDPDPELDLVRYETFSRIRIRISPDPK
jgi:hypothetical protein